MGELLNEVSTTETFTTYDRSYAGSFENPWEGRPSLTFHMARVTFRNSDEKLLSSESLPNVREPYTPGKVYQVYNPSTGATIDGAFFTSDQAYAFIYSMMMRAIADNKAVADAAAAVTVATSVLTTAQQTHEADVAANADQSVLDADLAAIAAAEATLAAATAALEAARAAVA